MGQTGCRLRFHAELGHKLLIASQLRLQHLDRHKTVQFVIPRTEYIRHSAGSYAIDNLIPILKKIACIQHKRYLL